MRLLLHSGAEIRIRPEHVESVYLKEGHLSCDAKLVVSMVSGKQWEARSSAYGPDFDSALQNLCLRLGVAP